MGMPLVKYSLNMSIQPDGNQMWMDSFMYDIEHKLIV